MKTIYKINKVQSYNNNIITVTSKDFVYSIPHTMYDILDDIDKNCKYDTNVIYSLKDINWYNDVLVYRENNVIKILNSSFNNTSMLLDNNVITEIHYDNDITDIKISSFACSIINIVINKKDIFVIRISDGKKKHYRTTSEIKKVYNVKNDIVQVKILFESGEFMLYKDSKLETISKNIKDVFICNSDTYILHNDGTLDISSVIPLFPYENLPKDKIDNIYATYNSLYIECNNNLYMYGYKNDNVNADRYEEKHLVLDNLDKVKNIYYKIKNGTHNIIIQYDNNITRMINGLENLDTWIMNHINYLVIQNDDNDVILRKGKALEHTPFEFDSIKPFKINIDESDKLNSFKIDWNETEHIKDEIIKKIFRIKDDKKE